MWVHLLAVVAVVVAALVTGILPVTHRSALVAVATTRSSLSTRPLHATSAPPDTTVLPTTPTTTTPAPPSAPPPTPRAVSARSVPPRGGATASGCAAALLYLAAYAAKGFTFECRGYALGHQAMTCDNVARVCPGRKLIAIADACPAAYMNEASNSWVVSGESDAPIDPYGYCH